MQAEITSISRGGDHVVKGSGRRRPARRCRVAAGAAALLFVPLAVACADDDSDSSDAATTDDTAAVGDAGSDDGGVTLGDIDQTVEAVLTSVDSNLGEVGPDGQVVFGWNHLVGEGTGAGSLGDGEVGVDMLGNVHYTDGSGDFFGFITFDFGGGDTLVVRMDGSAQAATDTSDATLDADLEVIGGTGALEDASGVGRFEGGRPDRLGGAVEGTYSFDLAS